MRMKMFNQGEVGSMDREGGQEREWFQTKYVMKKPYRNLLSSYWFKNNRIEF